MNMTAGELEVVLKAKDQLSGQMAHVDRNAGGLLGRFSKLKLAAVAAFAAAGAAAYKFGKAAYNSFMTTGDAIKTLVRMTNISVRSASILGEQWKIFGVDAGSGATALRFLSKNMIAAEGGSKTMIQTFKMVGLSVKDLAKSSSGDIMLKLRNSLSAMGDRTKRTAEMVALFGRGGMSMMPWIARAPKEISKMTKSMKDLGMVWGPKQMAEFDKVKSEQRDNALLWDAIKFKASQVIVPLVSKLLPMIATGLVKLQPAFSWLKTNVPKAFKSEAVQTWAHIFVAEITAVVGFFRAHWTEIVAIAKTVYDGLIAGVKYVVTVFKPVAIELVATVKKVVGYMEVWWRHHGETVKAVFANIVQIIKGTLNVVAGVIRLVMALIRGDWGTVWRSLVQIVKGVWQIIVGTVKGGLKLISMAISAAWSVICHAAMALGQGMVAGFKAGVKALWNFAASIPGRLLSVLGNLGRLLYSTGFSLITGLWNGIKDRAVGLWNDLKGIKDRIAGFIHFSHGPLYPVGQKLMAGLMVGLESQRDALRKTLGNVSADIARGVTIGRVPAFAGAGGYGGGYAHGGAPSAGRAPAAASPVGGASYSVQVDVHMPGGSAYIGTQRGLAQLLTPSIREELQKIAAAGARHR